MHPDGGRSFVGASIPACVDVLLLAVLVAFGVVAGPSWVHWVAGPVLGLTMIGFLAVARDDLGRRAGSIRRSEMAFELDRRLEAVAPAGVAALAPVLVQGVVSVLGAHSATLVMGDQRWDGDAESCLLLPTDAERRPDLGRLRLRFPLKAVGEGVALEIVLHGMSPSHAEVARALNFARTSRSPLMTAVAADAPVPVPVAVVVPAHRGTDTLRTVDAVTGLPLTDAFYATVDGALRVAGVHGSTPRAGRSVVGVLAVGVNGVETLATTLGPTGADALRAAVAKRVLAAVGKQSGGEQGAGEQSGGEQVDAGRLHGALGVLVPEGMDVLEAAARIQAAFAEPVTSGGTSLTLRIDLGIACAPADGTDAATLVDRAIRAMNGRGAATTTPGFADELRLALAAGALDVRFVPQVETGLGRLVGFEALGWWDHPSRGALVPASFGPTAAAHGLTRDVTCAVLDSAVAQAAVWYRAGTPLTCAVDVPAAYLLDTRLQSDVATVLARHGLPATLLVLQVLEPTGDEQARLLGPGLARLRQLGVRISVEDFGSTSSSVAFLLSSQADELKIDRAVVRGSRDQAEADALVRAAVGLGHALGLTVVADGVADAETLDRMTVLGCDMLSGPFLGRPETVAQVRARLGLTDAEQVIDLTAAGVPAPRRGGSVDLVASSGGHPAVGRGAVSDLLAVSARPVRRPRW